MCYAKEHDDPGFLQTQLSVEGMEPSGMMFKEFQVLAHRSDHRRERDENG